MGRFVQRDAGNIVATFAQRQDYATEELADDNPELQAFMNPPPKTIDEKAAEFVDAGDKLLRLMFEVTFNQENRIRVLEGKPVITRAQFRTALINFYKTL